MQRGLLSSQFTGVAVKKLSVVEASTRSNQHEFNGSSPLRRLLGDEDRKLIPTAFIWLGDEQEGISEDSTLTWYDSRRAQTHRAAEYRLYYPDNAVSELMQPGDTLFMATRPDGSIMVIVTPAESTIQNQLLWLFGVDQPELRFEVRDIDAGDERLDFAARFIMDELGIEPEEPEADFLDALLEKFGARFPTTRQFADFARASIPEVNPADDPDTVLMAWLEREELLFRRLERHIVADRLRSGFMSDETADVDGFIAFSLSVQNRRKSRAGQSLELHMEALLQARGIHFARGAETENRNKPDFLFPGQAEYRDPAYDASRLTMLGSKSSCKDRWRQVLSEAARIDAKHLLTLEPGISENQTDEMKAKQLQLVLPRPLHVTYRPAQQAWLMPVQGVIDLVTARQIA